MPSGAFDGLVIREPTVADHLRVLGAIDQWWGGLGGATASIRRPARLPRLFFEHFTGTSLLPERDGELVGFLIGFLSQSRSEEAYIHFVGVAPALRGGGVGAALYERFFAVARVHGRSRVGCTPRRPTAPRSPSIAPWASKWDRWPAPWGSGRRGRQAERRRRGRAGGLAGGRRVRPRSRAGGRRPAGW
jgi:GNAT superfamily N-acetyltransferase